MPRAVCECVHKGVFYGPGEQVVIDCQNWLVVVEELNLNTKKILKKNLNKNLMEVSMIEKINLKLLTLE